MLSSANTIASAHKLNHVKFPSKKQSQPFGKHMAANMNSLAKSCQKTWPDGSVAGVDTKKPDILSKTGSMSYSIWMLLTQLWKIQIQEIAYKIRMVA